MKSITSMAMALASALMLLGCRNPTVFKCDVVSGADCDGGIEATGGAGGGAGSGGGGGGNPALTVFAKRTLGPPAIDGRPDEAVWELSQSISRVIEGTHNNVSTFGVLWDDTFLYVAAKVLDADLRNDSEIPWFDDSVEVYVDGENERSSSYDGNDFHLIQGWNDTVLVAFPLKGAAGVLHATADMSGGYTVELAIPWNTLGIVPAANRLLGFDVQQNDDDTGGDGGDRDGAASWNATGNTNHQSTAEFGRLVLTLETVGTGTGGGAGGTGGGRGGGTGGGGGGTGVPSWTRVPIKTALQKARGQPGGEGFQMIFDLEYAASAPEILYFVTDTNGVWKSTDGGATWNPKHNGFATTGGQSLGISPTNPNLVLVAGADMLYPTWPTGLRGIIRTTDGGDHWALVRKTPYSRHGSMGGARFAFGGNNVVYTGTGMVDSAGVDAGEGLLKSTDSGATWSVLVDFATTGKIFDVKVQPKTFPPILFLATSKGLLKVADGASPSIARVGAGLPQSPSMVATDAANPSVMYVSQGTSGVYRSTDSGLNFTPRSSGLPSLGSAISLAISSANPNYLYANSGNGFYYSHDGAATWQLTSTTDADGIVSSFFSWAGSLKGRPSSSAFAPHPANPEIAFTYNVMEQPLKTTDGGRSWAYSASGYTGAGNGRIDTYSPMGFVPGSKRMLFGLIDFGSWLTDDGETFVKLPAPYAGYNAAHSSAIEPRVSGDPVMVVAYGDQSGGSALYVSNDLGQHWVPGRDTSTADGGTYLASSYKFVSFHPQKPNIIYAEYRRSFDKGATWAISNDRNKGPIQVVFPGNGDIVYTARSENGKVAVYKAMDGTAPIIDFTAVYPLIDAPAGSVQRFAVGPKNPDRLYVPIRGKGLFIITDVASRGGVAKLKDFTNTTPNPNPAGLTGLLKDQFDEHNIVMVAVDPNHEERVYAIDNKFQEGMGNGVFRSTDFGETWTHLTQGIGTHFSPISVVVNPTDSYVYIFGAHGTWKLPPP